MNSMDMLDKAWDAMERAFDIGIDIAWAAFAIAYGIYAIINYT